MDKMSRDETLINDLVDEMQWKDLVNFESLESAGLENDRENDSVTGVQKVYYTEEGWE